MFRQATLVVAVSLLTLGVGTAQESATESKATPESKGAESKSTSPDSATIAAGAKLYAQYCLTCHGKKGAGDGPAAASLNPKPRDFRDPNKLKSQNDDELFKVIRKGGPALKLSPVMVGWEVVLKEPQIRQVIAFLHTLADSAQAAEKKTESTKKKDP